MAQETRSGSVFSAVEADQWSEAPSLSWLAVAALAAGIASAGAVATPLLWCLPLAGIALGVAALISIRRDPQRRFGRAAAVSGMAFSLLFAAWGVSHYLVRQQFLHRQAHELAQQWLQLVQQGRLQEAHQLQLPQLQRRQPGTPLANFYAADQEIVHALEAFRRGRVVRELARRGPAAELRFLGYERAEAERGMDGYTEAVTLRYLLGGSGEPLEFRISLARTRGREAEARWRVLDVRAADAETRR